MSAKEIDKKRQAYQAVFKGVHGKEVLMDLAVLCGAASVPYNQFNTHDTAFRCGRLEVWKRIQGYLALSDQDVFDIAKKQNENIKQEYAINE